MSTSRVGDVTLSGRVLTHEKQRYDLADAHASIEADGDVVARFTATRILAHGVFALAFKRKKDKRGLYLLVEGPDFAFVDELDPKKDALRGGRTPLRSAGRRAVVRPGRRRAPRRPPGGLGPGHRRVASFAVQDERAARHSPGAPARGCPVRRKHALSWPDAETSIPRRCRNIHVKVTSAPTTWATFTQASRSSACPLRGREVAR
jgi:hypothetical protein